MEYPEPEARARIGWARETARSVAKRYGLKPPVDVHGLASAAGLKVAYDLIAVPAQYYREERLIVVKKDEHRHRQRFSIAHELGHWFLHHDVMRDKCTECGDGFRAFERAVEAEAHEFAAELLVPLTILNRLVKEGASPSQMASAFDVSEAALWVRLTRTGKIGRIRGGTY